MVSDDNKIIMVFGSAFLLLFCIFQILNYIDPSLTEESFKKNELDCSGDPKKQCFRYITDGGIFGGVNTVQVSCKEQHDFYRIDERKYPETTFRKCESWYEERYEE